MKSSIDHMMTCSLSWSKLGGGAARELSSVERYEYEQDLVKNLPTRASHWLIIVSIADSTYAEEGAPVSKMLFQ